MELSSQVWDPHAKSTVDLVVPANDVATNPGPLNTDELDRGEVVEESVGQ